MVVHRGRKSGREYRTPVNLFRAGDERFVVALTYGPGTAWVKNVLAAGGCEIRTRGRSFRARDPRVYHDEARRGIRPLERQALGLLAVTDGAAGAVLLDGGVEVARAQPPKVDAVDGTGAGDAFTACLVVSLLEGREQEEALRRACIAGALAASTFGAQTSLPTADEVDKLL